MLARILSFSATVGLVSLAGLIAIPLLIVTVGAEEWALMALLQALAQVFGVVVAFGWGATGPSMIAAAAVDERRGIFRESLFARLALYVIVAPAMGIIALALTRGDTVLSFLGSFVFLLPFVASPWFFVGEARPLRLLLLNTTPSVLGTLGGLVAASIWQSLTAFLIVQGAGYVLAIVLESTHILRRRATAPTESLTPRRMLMLLGSQRHAVTSTIVSSVYVAVPVIAVQTFAPAHLPVYALADRLFKFASVALSPIQQFLQGWVPEAGPASIPHRVGRAAITGAGFGLVGGVLVALFSPWVSRLLSGGDVSVPFTLSIPLGIAFVFIAIAAIVGFACLTLLGQVRHVAIGAVLAACIGTPLIVLAALGQSLALVAWAIALSEFAVAAYQLIVLRRTLATARTTA